MNLLERLFGEKDHQPHLYLFTDDDGKHYALIETYQPRPRLKLKRRTLQQLGGIQTTFQSMNPDGRVIYGVPPEKLLQRVTHITLDGNDIEHAFRLQGNKYQNYRPLQARVMLEP